MTFGNMTGLMIAASNGQEECVQALLQVNANTELLDVEGRTALRYARAHGYKAIAKLIRQHAAQPQPPTSLPRVLARGISLGEDGVHAKDLPKAWWKPDMPGASTGAGAAGLIDEFSHVTENDTGRQWYWVTFTVLVGLGVNCAIFWFWHLRRNGLTARTARADEAARALAEQAAAAAPTTSARELAVAALQQAIGAGELEPLRKAIGTHAADAEGTSVLKEARTLRDRLAEQQRKAAKEAKLAGRREQKQREGEERAAAEAKAAVAAEAERTEAKARAAAEEQAAVARAAVEQVARERAAAAEEERVAAERAAATERERAAAERADAVNPMSNEVKMAA